MKKVLALLSVAFTLQTNAQTTVDFENFTLTGTETHFDGSDMSGVSNGSGLFESTYTEGDLTFSSIYDTTWGISYGYWAQGWAFTNETPDNISGYAGLFSSYAGGGDASTNYVIGQNNARIIKTNSAASFESLRITNNNYASSSMQNGDAFAKAFGGSTGDDPDFFLVSIIGYDANQIAIDTIEFYLADYRFSDNNQDYIVKDWTTVDLSSIGQAEYIDFVLSSTDSSGGYMNTPAFFAMDKVTYSTTSGINELEEVDIKLYPNPALDQINFNSDQTILNITVLNIQGQIIRSSNFINAKSLIVSDLVPGLYTVVIRTSSGTAIKKFQKL